MEDDGNIEFGEYSYGRAHIHVHSWGETAKLRIGKFCSIAKNITVLLGGNHRTDWISTYPFGILHQDKFACTEQKSRPYSKGDIIVGNDVWIGHGAVLMSGVTIGHGAVIAAFSVVTKDIPPYTIVSGSPAIVRKKRFSDEITQRLLKLKWWDLPDNTISEIAEILTSEPTIEMLDSLIANYT